jgi:NADPH-dependent ferric siderophore reductase
VAPELINRIALRAHVTDIARAAERTWLIRIAGPALEGLDWIPGQHVRVLTNGPLEHVSDLLRISMRTYSVWSYEGDRIELCVYEHAEDGPGSRWAAGLRVGDEVSFRRPEGRLVLDPAAPYHLFVGEETAAVPFGAMLRALPTGADAYAVLEAIGPAARLALPGKAEVIWVDRGEASAANSAPLVEALRAARLPQAPGVAYVAGEARTCQAVRSHLVRDRGWPRRSVIVKPFWTPGKRGME